MAFNKLPTLIFSDIMMMVGLESLNGLHRCRQVCKTWNELILRVIWENKSRKQIMKGRIERSWGPGMFPTDEEISRAKWLEAQGILSTEKIQRLIKRVKDVFCVFFGNKDMISWIRCGASLAHHGLLNGMVGMAMEDVDLSSVPAEHLVSLTSNVKVGLCIKNVSGCDLVSIFTSLKCSVVTITNQSLGREETRALVQKMEMDGIWRGLGILNLDEVTLDIEALVEYSGKGPCSQIRLNKATLDRYSEELRTWAKSKNWGEYVAPLRLENQTVFKRFIY